MQMTKAAEQSQDSNSQDSNSQDSNSQDSNSQDSNSQDSNSQDSKRQAFKSQHVKRQHSDLDNRYGKIGISAVAAAVRHCSERPNPAEIRSFLYDRD